MHVEGFSLQNSEILKSYIDVENSHCWTPTQNLLVSCPDRLGEKLSLIEHKIDSRWDKTDVFDGNQSYENAKKPGTCGFEKRLLLWI